MTAPHKGADLRVAAAGDSALVLELAQRIDPAVNERARVIAASLQARWGAILRDVVVGYCSVTVYFDPLRVDAPWLESEMRAAAAQLPENGLAPGALVEVPVCYEGDLAPDLDDVAAFGGCSRDEVIALHAAVRYRVYMIGFTPGFAYLAEVNGRIAAPRRQSPRPSVPAGAVGVAGGQTGIYPAATPGGWNIIGRTRVRPYDASRRQPSLFAPGDEVRFVPVPRAEFEGSR